MGKWNLLSAVSSWTHSRLCRAGWMWSRETWTDSFRSMRCSCLRMDTGTRPSACDLSLLANWLWQSDLVLIAFQPLRHLYWRFAKFPLLIIKLAVCLIHNDNDMVVYVYVRAGSVVCLKCWRPTHNTNQTRVTARHRGLLLPCSWWTCQLRYN